MRLLIVSPDYLSHALPLVQIGRAWRGGQGEVVVATGSATRPLVEQAGLGWTGLRLGAGRNDGVIEVAGQPAGEDEHLRAFFASTRVGPVATLLYQADARRHDLLHEPDRVLDRLTVILDDVKPDRVLVDHVAFGARLALHALGVHPATAVVGHPSALSGPGEIYGLPPVWPAAMTPAPADLEQLAARCAAAVQDLGSAADELLARRASAREAVGDLTSTPGTPTIHVYPEALRDRAGAVSADRIFVGALPRSEELGGVVPPRGGDGPRVLVALGSFLSARDDVLRAAVEAARMGGWRLALAHGSTAPEQLGPLPPGALVARHLPQVALLRHTDVFIHHGGNGSITEAVSAGVPMVVLPFSTDQFAGAAAIERAGLGVVRAPNGVSPALLVDAVADVLGSDAGARARSLDDGNGADTAARAIAALGSPVPSTPVG